MEGLKALFESALCAGAASLTEKVEGLSEKWNLL